MNANRQVFTLPARNAGGRVGDAMAYVLDASELFEFALPHMRAVAKDPLAADLLKENDRM